MTGFIIVAVFLVIFGFGRKAAKSKVDPSNLSPRVQKLLERMQAQQGGLQPPVLGQFTQPTSGQPLPGQLQGQTFPAAPPTQVRQSGRAQSSAQLAGLLQSLLQAGQQNGYSQPGQYQPAPQQQGPQPTNWPPQYQQAPQQQTNWAPQYQAAPQYPAPQYPQAQQMPQVPQYAPQANRTQHGRQPAHNFPAANSPLERRIRELMSTGHEVSAIRLLCDEQDLGIIEAQEYARGLVAPAGKAGASTDSAGSRSDATDDENRYVGSAAFAESVFDLDRDENVWASGWVDKAEPEDRTDIDELWQTVRNAGGRPPTPAS
ncbi:hypothetical protein AB0P21_26415 [Kribbella sp. NPDC056861]|uniref:hypothetical protein n=1 Tax=Kribbella sp. NPDC056861 TaxID=3154857 RepID=UPI00343C9E13